MKPSISVVVPLYNKEKSVTRCLASILQQTYPATEIIIVNDGSTDNSLAVVKKITDPRIVLYDQKNGGVSRARNSGITQARYELVALLDADDEWDLTFLEKMVSAIENHPEAGLFYAAHTNKNGQKILSTAVPHLPSDFCGSINIFNLNTDQGPWSSAVIIRKSFLPKTGLFNPQLVKGEDIDLWIRFALHGSTILLNTPLSTCHGDAENRAMQKPSPPQASLVSNLAQYEIAAKNNPVFYSYLQQMRVAHICNFLGGNPCELADAHHEIDQLDLSVLPSIWTWIKRAPRNCRRFLFKAHCYANRVWQLLLNNSRKG